jgi:oxalate decarboxylase/phosphoglucose isomerase-like protein (cupin superfamily)
MPVEYAPPWPHLALVHQHHREGTLVLIQRGDTHEVRNTGSGPLKTLNVYIPPAYTEGGEELPAGRS